MQALFTTLKTRWTLLALATLMSAAIVVASPTSNAFAAGGECNNFKGIQVNVLSCVVDDVKVEIEHNDILTDNEVNVILERINVDITVCRNTGGGNSTVCAVYILNDLVDLLAKLDVDVSKITVIVKDVIVFKKW